MPLGRLGDGTVVFIPGIMGSELRESGRDARGVPQTDVVWGGDIRDVWNSLCRSPERLTAKNLVATEVIREIRYSWWKKEPVYGPLLDFCCSSAGLGLRIGRNFRTFPYDWRLDLRNSAKQLGELVESLPEPVFIVAHSMGGLVTRLMLNTPLPGSSKVKGVFQIASPVAGSSKAYFTLKREPDLGAIGHAMAHLYRMFNHSSQARLMLALRNMPALYQLLPPINSKILLRRGGAHKSAVDTDGWLDSDQIYLRAASAVHTLLEKAPPVKIKCVYSIELMTDWMYEVTEHWQIRASQPQTDGDGTVTGASAIAVSEDFQAFGGDYAEHMTLCANPDVHEELRRFLS
ncbi:hypothetical protein LJR034_005275 [Caballeronia sp. LjRoot34]|uniref:lipase/acyltransferase domain-containing protein n=1 Tax=Caballeronia sp. LjRoot34 TaxID=3342325 RepID=UPI003ECE25EE